MTQEQHPITPSPFQLDHWEAKSRATTDPSLLNEPAIRAGRFGVVHRKALCLAFAAGADQELEACLEWMAKEFPREGAVLQALRKARRPKPPSLKERGREALQNIHAAVVMETGGRELDVLKEIVESLPD